MGVNTRAIMAQIISEKPAVFSQQRASFQHPAYKVNPFQKRYQNTFPNQVIVSAHLTEKASLVGQFANTYVFKVASKATKLEIKKAVENKFNVTVTKVNLLNVKGKMKRGGKGKLTKKSNWKKAYISLKNEDRIEISQD